MSLASHAYNRLQELYRGVFLRMKQKEAILARGSVSLSPVMEQLEPRLLLSVVSIGDTSDQMVFDGRLLSVYEQITSAPGATVTNVEYGIQVRDEGNFVIRLSDYDGWIWSDATDVWFWDNYGGTTDYGFDDDGPDDADIWIVRTTHQFDGEPVNGLWGMTVWDKETNVYDGEIDFW